MPIRTCTYSGVWFFCFFSWQHTSKQLDYPAVFDNTAAFIAAYEPRRGSVARRFPPQPVPPPRLFFARTTHSCYKNSTFCCRMTILFICRVPGPIPFCCVVRRIHRRRCPARFQGPLSRPLSEFVHCSRTMSFYNVHLSFPRCDGSFCGEVVLILRR